VNYFYCDASAIVKRYVLEDGSELVNHLFNTVQHKRLVILTQGIGEICWALVRRRNAGLIPISLYQQAMHAMRLELLLGNATLCSVYDDLIYTSFAYIERHSLNAADAVVLRSALDTATEVRNIGHQLVFVASDQRLIRAAQAEGLTTFNPETASEQDLANIL
jgi:predicted nucleic acid-binding protein